MDNKIRIVIIDDHSLFREGLKSIFSLEKDIQVVGEAADGKKGLEVIRETRPDVVLLDISMPGISGLETCRQISIQVPESKIIFLTIYKNDKYISDGFSSGAKGYVLKHSAVDELASAIRTVYSGKKFISPDISSGIIDTYVQKMKQEEPTPLESKLTDREKEIVRLIAQGWNNNEIAQAIHISPHTVKTHRSNIMKKLGFHKNIELVKFAIRTGIIDLE